MASSNNNNNGEHEQPNFVKILMDKLKNKQEIRSAAKKNDFLKGFKITSRPLLGESAATVASGNAGKANSGFPEKIIQKTGVLGKKTHLGFVPNWFFGGDDDGSSPNPEIEKDIELISKKIMDKISSEFEPTAQPIAEMALEIFKLLHDRQCLLSCLEAGYQIWTQDGEASMDVTQLMITRAILELIEQERVLQIIMQGIQKTLTANGLTASDIMKKCTEKIDPSTAGPKTEGEPCCASDSVKTKSKPTRKSRSPTKAKGPTKRRGKNTSSSSCSGERRKKNGRR